MRRVTLAQIEAFCSIMRYGSFHAAAEQLNLTQPSLSVRIRGMEDVLGFRLFKKVGRRTRPTMDAEAILPKAERLLAMADDFCSKPKQSDPLRGVLRLGAPDCFGLVCLPELLVSLKSRFPNLRSAITIDKAPALCQALNNRELDIAFLTEPRTAGHIKLRPLGHSSHVWVAGRGVALPNRVVTPQDLVDYEVLAYPAPSNQMSMILDWFSGASVRPPPIRTCSSLAVIIPLVIAGAAISLLPTGYLRNDPRSRQLRYLEAKPVIANSQYVAAYQADKLGGVLQSVIEMAWTIMCDTRFVEQGPMRPAQDRAAPAEVG